jgi:superfamily I DNA/RNA helicase
MTHPVVAARLARLTPDQRAAATAPPGPVLCVAPAGSGKTTTLVARIAWLVDEGADPGTITAITFNRGAANELAERLDVALAELGRPPGSVRVRTFHALGREVLREAGVDVAGLVDRAIVLEALFPDLDAAGRLRLDTAFSRLKLEHETTANDVAADPTPGPVGEAFVRYERELAARGGLDFDDLVRRTLVALDRDAALLDRWRQRCAHLLVDEVQDVDRSQLRLALLLAAPANRCFLVGDDDQSIYGWRLADVRRVLALDASLPGLRRVDLAVNHRCPPPVVDRAVRLIGHNRERFAKTIHARPGAVGCLVLAPDPADEPMRTARLLAALPPDDGTSAILARTNRELQPAIVAALAAERPFRAGSVGLPIEDARLDDLLEGLETTEPEAPLLVRVGRLRSTTDPATRPLVTALLAWAAAFHDLATLRAAIDDTRRRLAALRRDDATLSLATAHATKGAEFDHVAVVGLDVGRFPSGRSIAESAEPERALEEERRLGYVAWTRARRTLILSYDPGAPSPFLLEAFSPDELGVSPGTG